MPETCAAASERSQRTVPAAASADQGGPTATAFARTLRGRLSIAATRTSVWSARSGSGGTSAPRGLDAERGGDRHPAPAPAALVGGLQVPLSDEERLLGARPEGCEPLGGLEFGEGAERRRRRDRHERERLLGLASRRDVVAVLLEDRRQAIVGAVDEDADHFPTTRPPSTRRWAPVVYVDSAK